MQKQIRRMYDFLIRLAGHKHAVWALAGVSFAESSFFPLPPDIMLIPMCVTNRQKAFWYATVCTAFSVIGGLLGYAIGYYFYQSWGQQIIHFYGMTDKFHALQLKYDEYGGWILFLKGMTPIPYKILTILSGVMHLAIPVFIVASIAGRAVRFYLVAGLLWKFGAPIQEFIEKRLMWVTFLFLILLIGGFVALKYIL
ncbi:MAG: DedA family protein [Alphaproteobacteria bacterium]|nr:DedA family protein [Alphaproteobacteria bacterium]